MPWKFCGYADGHSRDMLYLKNIKSGGDVATKVKPGVTLRVLLFFGRRKFNYLKCGYPADVCDEIIDECNRQKNGINCRNDFNRSRMHGWEEHKDNQTCKKDGSADFSGNQSALQHHITS